MSFQFPICGVIDGDSLFQQIENHLADSIDLIGVGVCQHVLTLVSIGFFQDALQKGALSSQPLHRRFLCPVGKTASYMMSHDAAAWISFPVPFVNHPTVEAFCSSTSFVLLILLFVASNGSFGLFDVDGFLEGLDQFFGHFDALFDIHRDG